MTGEADRCLTNERQITVRAYLNVARPDVMSLCRAHLKAKAPRHDGTACFVARCAMSTIVHLVRGGSVSDIAR